MAISLLADVDNSAYLETVPAIDATLFLNVTPASYATWEAMRAANPTILDFCLAAGDYTSWGDLVFTNKVGGVAGRPKTIRYAGANASTHPALRTADQQARLERLDLEAANTKYWTFQGLYFNNSTDTTDTAHAVAQGANNIVIDKCWFEGARTYCWRLRDCSFVTIQNTVIEDMQDVLDSDAVGIQTKPAGPTGTTNFKIIACRISNCGDGIQLTDGGNDGVVGNRTWQTTGRIRDNDIYIDASQYLTGTNTTNRENGIDIKAGCDTANGIIIEYNRIWGMRRNSSVVSSEGEAIVIQRFARNIVIRYNIIGDCPRAFKDENWKVSAVTGAGAPGTQDPDESRVISITGNWIFDVRDRATADVGAVFKPITDIAYTNNIISRCDYLCDISPSAYRGAGPAFTGNILSEVDAIQRPEDITPALPYNPASNTSTSTAGIYFLYERRRWASTSEFAIGAQIDAAAVYYPPDPVEDPDPEPVTPPRDPLGFSHRGRAAAVLPTGSVSHRVNPGDL